MRWGAGPENGAVGRSQISLKPFTSLQGSNAAISAEGLMRSSIIMEMLYVQLGVGIKTDEDRKLAKLLQTPRSDDMGADRGVYTIYEQVGLCRISGAASSSMGFDDLTAVRQI
jgi:hypothetical protein